MIEGHVAALLGVVRHVVQLLDAVGPQEEAPRSMLDEYGGQAIEVAARESRGSGPRFRPAARAPQTRERPPFVGRLGDHRRQPGHVDEGGRDVDQAHHAVYLPSLRWRPGAPEARPDPAHLEAEV